MRYTASQMAVARFSIAIDRRRGKDGEERGADFPNVVVFGRQAENAGKYLTKGRQVAIEGRLQTGSYEKQDGTKVYTTDVIADRIEYLGGQKNDHTTNVPAPAATLPEDQVEYEGFHAYEEDDEFIPF